MMNVSPPTQPTADAARIDDDVQALAALVEKMEQRRLRRRSPRRATLGRDGGAGDNGTHATARDEIQMNAETDAASRSSHHLLACAREYLAAVTASEREQDCAVHAPPRLDGDDANGTRDDDERGARGGGHNGKIAAAVRGFDMTAPSDAGESVLVGVLKRENASLVAKIRRLEEEAKRMDDKTAWGEEHLVNRLKFLEAQCAEAAVEKEQLRHECAAELSRADELRRTVECFSARLAETERLLSEAKAVAATRETELDELKMKLIAKDTQLTEAQRATHALEAQFMEAKTAAALMKTQLVEATSARALVDTHLDEAKEVAVAKDAQLQEAKTLLSELESQLNKEKAGRIVAEAQLQDLIVVRSHLEGQLSEAMAAVADTNVELKQAKTAATLLRTQLSEVQTTAVAAASAAANKTRGKRSDTMETCGTESDSSDSPTRLSLCDLVVHEESSEPSLDDDDALSKKPTRQLHLGDAGETPEMDERASRRRTGVRGRSGMGSVTSRHKPMVSDAALSCSRLRCARPNQLTSPTPKSESVRKPRRASIQSPSPLQLPLGEPPARPRPASAHLQSRNSSGLLTPQIPQERPRWRW